MYGQEDGLYSIDQINTLRKIIDTENVFYWEKCSHNVYLDQPTLFLETVSDWVVKHQ